MLKKYIAYARINIHPVTTQEVQEYIREFYINIRKIKLANPSGPVPITARNVEAIQRLSEASAECGYQILFPWKMWNLLKK